MFFNKDPKESAEILNEISFSVVNITPITITTYKFMLLMKKKLMLLSSLLHRITVFATLIITNTRSFVVDVTDLLFHSRCC